MTMVVSWPSWRVIIGPWILASLERDLWGLSPILRRFPIMGNGVGPGGRFDLRVLLRMYVRRRHIMQMKTVSMFLVKLRFELKCHWILFAFIMLHSILVKLTIAPSQIKHELLILADKNMIRVFIIMHYLSTYQIRYLFHLIFAGWKIKNEKANTHGEGTKPKRDHIFS